MPVQQNPLHNANGKLLLGWSEVKGKSLMEVVVLHEKFSFGENCIRVNGGCTILQFLLHPFF